MISILNEQNLISDFYVLFMFPISYMIFNKIIQNNKKYLNKLYSNTIESEHDFEYFTQRFIYLIENYKQNDIKNEFQGLLFQHVKKCTDANCYCNKLKWNINNQQEYNHNQVLEHQLENYRFLEYLIKQRLQTQCKSFRLNLFYAYLLSKRFMNNYKGIQQLIIIQDNNPSYVVQFSIFKLKSDIEESFLKQINDKQQELQKIYLFDQQFQKLKYEMNETMKYQLYLWQELLKSKINFKNIIKIGKNLLQSINKCHDQFLELSNQHNQSCVCFQIYGLFQKYVLNQDKKGKLLIEKAELIQKSNQKYITPDVNLNIQEFCIIQVSGNLQNFGMILKLNEYINELTNYEKDEILFQSIKIFMPKYLEQRFEKWVLNQYDQGELQFQQKFNIFFLKNKQGYLNIVNINIKQVMNLDQGLQYLAFIAQCEKTNPEKHFYMLYLENSMVLLGISENVHTKFGISNYLVYGQEIPGSFCIQSFSLNSILQTQQALDSSQVFSKKKLICTLDTSSLDKDFLLGNVIDDNNGEFMNYDQYQSINQNKFKKATIKLSINSIWKNNEEELILGYFKMHTLEQCKSFYIQTNSNIGQINFNNKKENKKRLRRINSLMESFEGDISKNQNTENEKQKYLQDLQEKLSIRNTFFSINGFKLTIFINMLSFIILNSFKISNQLNQITDSQKGTYFLLKANEKILNLANINYYVRQTQYEITQNHEIQAYLVTLQQQLQLSHEYDSVLSDLINIVIESEQVKQVNISIFETNQQIINLTQDLDSSLIQYTSSLQNLLKNQFYNVNDQTSESYQYFYYIIQNGQNGLRIKFKDINQIFYQHFQNKQQNYQSGIEIISILGLVLVICAAYLQILFESHIRSKMHQILSIFFMIKHTDLAKLIQDLRIFQSIYNKSQVLLLQHVYPDSIKPDNEADHQKNQDFQQTQQLISNNDNNEELGDQSIVSQEYLEFQNSIIKKNDLNQSKTFNKQSIATFFLVVYYIYVYFKQLSLNQQMQFDFEYFKFLIQQESNIRYIMVFCQEQNVMNHIKIEKDFYLDQQMDIQQFIRREYQLNGNMFENYQFQFNEIFYNSICLKDQPDYLTCKQKFKEKSLREVQTILIEKLIDDLNNFYNLNQNLDRNTQAYQNRLAQLYNTDYIHNQNITWNYISQAQFELRTIFYQQIQAYMQSNIQYIYFEFFLILTVLLFYFLFIWNPLSQILKNNIWECKDLLKIIPINLIISDQRLHKYFTSSKLQELIN